MSPAGTSKFGPICLHNSVIKLWQNLIISLSDFPLGLKSEPPLPPPIGKPVKEFLNICSNPRNFIMLKLTDGWNLSPPLYGPIALLNCTRNPLLTWTFPLSSTQGTLNIICLSGSTILPNIFCFIYSGCLTNTGSNECSTSSIVWWNSLSPIFLAFTWFIIFSIVSLACASIVFPNTSLFSNPILIAPFYIKAPFK